MALPFTSDTDLKEYYVSTGFMLQEIVPKLEILFRTEVAKELQQRGLVTLISGSLDDFPNARIKINW